MKYSPRHRTLRYHLWTILSYIVTNITVTVLWIWLFGFNRTRIIGKENLRGLWRNTLLVANHQSMIDSFLIGMAAFYPRSWVYPSLLPWNPAAVENFFEPWWLGWLARQWKCIPIREGRRDLKALKTMVEVMPHGVMTLFPEGTRSRDGSVGAGRAGSGMLVLSARPTVVPVAIEGMRDVLPIGKHFPRVGKRIYVSFGKPVDCTDLFERKRGKDTAQELVDRVMDRVRVQHTELLERKRSSR